MSEFLVETKDLLCRTPHAVFSEWVDFADGVFGNFLFHLDGTVHIE